MTDHTTHHPTIVAERHAAGRFAPVRCDWATSTRTDAPAASERLALIAAMLRHQADAMETILPATRADVRADLAALREIAGNVEAYGTEDAA